MKKKIIVLYVEGETEDEFYNRVKEYLKNKSNDNYIIKVICVKSNSRFSNKLINKFKNEIINKYTKEEKVVCLCYDSDGYEFGKHPSFDAKKLDKSLKELGTKKVIHIVANKSIEDFIMIDEDSVKKFLNLPKNIKAKGKNGLEKIKDLYSKANRTYFKGSKTAGLINSLEIDKICDSICPELSELCNEMGVKCEKCRKSLNNK